MLDGHRYRRCNRPAPAIEKRKHIFLVQAFEKFALSAFHNQVGHEVLKPPAVSVLRCFRDRFSDIAEGRAIAFRLLRMSQIREVITGSRPWPSQYTYAPAMRVGNMVWLSGATATDDTGKIVAPGDIVEQTRQIFRKFEALLNSVGASCEDIVQTCDFFVTTKNYNATAAVRREFLKSARPASAGVLVAGLLREGALIEISAVAMLRHE